MSAREPLRQSEGPANEGMKQTKPAFFSDCAGFAAYPRCSADGLAPGEQTAKARDGVRAAE